MARTTVVGIRISALDRDNIRRIIVHVRRLNREIGITSPVTIGDAIGWALQRCVLLLEQERADE